MPPFILAKVWCDPHLLDNNRSPGPGALIATRWSCVPDIFSIRGILSSFKLLSPTRWSPQSHPALSVRKSQGRIVISSNAQTVKCGDIAVLIISVPPIGQNINANAIIEPLPDNELS